MKLNESFSSRLSESHARLSLRSEVTIEDAVFACHFYEECVTSLSGVSYLGVDPKPHILGAGLDESLGRGHDRYMKEFQARLVRFVMEYSENTDNNEGDNAGRGFAMKNINDHTRANSSFMCEE